MTRSAFVGKGQAIFDINITREGDVMHENVGRPKGVSNPLNHAAALANAFLAQDQALSAGNDYPLVGPETHFLGQIHGGDFFNRIPTKAYINGIHRFWPDKSWDDIGRRLDALIASVPCAHRCACLYHVERQWSGL